MRAGAYGPAGRRRQLWWCYPDGKTKTDAHRFAEALLRMLLNAPGHVCTERATTLERFEGPQHPRGYEFAARTIATALVAVGNGASYYRAARTARTTSRDERMLAALSDLVRTRSAERIDVAVVCGAAHVPSIVRGLNERHGYRPRTAEWLTVLPA